MGKKFLFIVLFLAGMHVNAQTEWHLKKDEDGIKVFTANTANSDFKTIKVECTIKSRLSQLVAFLLDIDKQHEWVFNTKTSNLVKKVKDNEFIFYSEVSVPWPCTDRDYIADFVIAQPSAQLLTIDSHAEPDLLPHKEGKIRVKTSIAHWDVVPIGNDQLKIVYTVSFDPSGSVPAWLTNMFVARGPFQTFEKLRAGVDNPTYANAHVNFIKD